MRNSIACTMPTASTACNTKPLNAPVSFDGNQVVVAGIGVDDAAASGRDAIKAAFIDRLQERENGAGSLHLLRFDQLLAAPELARRDVILLAGHHHRNNGPGL